MTIEQLKLLECIYDEPKSINKVYTEFHLNLRALQKLTYDIGNYFVVQKKLPFEESLLLITNTGKEAVEASRAENEKKHISSVRYWITTGIAIAAIVISVVSLIISLK